MSFTRAGVLGASMLALALAAPAHAQKSKDTLRYAIVDMFGGMDPYNFPHDEGGAVQRTVFNNLVDFDEWNGKFVPALAKSWTRIDGKTLEFELRDDITFHNGNKFEAVDVKATVDWLTDPKTTVRLKSQYEWASVEVLGPHKIRVHSKQPFATDLSELAYRFKILDAETMKSVENMVDYGRLKPYGTGPYKVSDLDRNRGIMMEGVANHWDKSGNQRAPVKWLHGIPLPDRQTQIAQLLTGGVDLVRNIAPDMATELAGKGFAISSSASQNLLYITLDAAGRSANKVMMDERVRKAFFMSFDRAPIVRTFVPGGDMAEIPAGICFTKTIACEVTSPVLKYDPEQAKRLLAEAGYPNGIDVRFDAGARVAQIAEAIAGEARRVGIRMNVNPLSLTVAGKMRGDGELTAYLNYFPTSTQPDTSNILAFFFSADRDYWQDPEIHKIMAAGQQEFDLAKRTKVYVPALNRINEKAYVMPVSEMPVVSAHTKDVKVLSNMLSAAETRPGDYAWSDYRDPRAK